MQKALRDYYIVYAGLGCTSADNKCQDPAEFMDNLPRAIEACGCALPVTVTQSNSKMVCFNQGSDMACA